MSVHAMTNAALARRLDFPPLNRVPESRSEIAAAAATPVPQDAATAALAVIVTYVPTEVLTLYIAVLAALRTTGTNTAPDKGGSLIWQVSATFLVLTPFVVWLVYAAKVKAAIRRLPLNPHQWPVWEMSAGALAFVAWAVALPDAPFLECMGLPSSLGAVIVIATAAGLGLLAPLFQRAIVNGPQPRGSN